MDEMKTCKIQCNNLSSFLWGVLIGVGIGFIYAPLKGRELRNRIRSKTDIVKKKYKNVREKSK